MGNDIGYDKLLLKLSKRKTQNLVEMKNLVERICHECETTSPNDDEFKIAIREIINSSNHLHSKGSLSEFIREGNLKNQGNSDVTRQLKMKVLKNL